MIGPWESPLKTYPVCNCDGATRLDDLERSATRAGFRSPRELENPLIQRQCGVGESVQPAALHVSTV
jgi:hypothetical protein